MASDDATRPLSVWLTRDRERPLSRGLQELAIGGLESRVWLRPRSAGASERQQYASDNREGACSGRSYHLIADPSCRLSDGALSCVAQAAEAPGTSSNH